MSQIYKSATGSSPSIPTSFETDDGTAVPALNILNVFGGPGISTSGSGNTVTISQNGVVANYTDVVGPQVYIVQVDDYYISCDTSGGAITITLPDFTTLYRALIIKDRTGDASTNNITITTLGGIVFIDGDPDVSLIDDYEDVQILYNGSAYEIF